MILIITTTTTGLMAGLFFAWSFSVTPGLARLPDKEYVTAIQSMNRAILNPVFFICFFGTAILLPLSTWLQYNRTLTIHFWLLLLSSVTYLTGVMGITIFGNVPLNNTLDAFNVQASSMEDITIQRSMFEKPWNKLNNIRTVAATISLILAVTACIKSGASAAPSQ